MTNTLYKFTFKYHSDHCMQLFILKSYIDNISLTTTLGHMQTTHK